MFAWIFTQKLYLWKSVERPEDVFGDEQAELMPVELFFKVRQDIDDLFILDVIVVEHFWLKLITFNDDVSVVLMRRSLQLNLCQEFYHDSFVCATAQVPSNLYDSCLFAFFIGDKPQLEIWSFDIYAKYSLDFSAQGVLNSRKLCFFGDGKVDDVVNMWDVESNFDGILVVLDFSLHIAV